MSLPSVTHSSQDTPFGGVPHSKALVLHPYLRSPRDKAKLSASVLKRTPEHALEEAINLSQAIRGLEVVHGEVVSVRAVRPSTFIGKGGVDQFTSFIKAQEIELVIMNHALSPVQQRNLERIWHCKVIDRTGLILEIFGERAHTSEGSLQVELAALTYQRSRLVKSWTHLERQRGGFGFLGGPGESQLEIDRRIIDDRLAHIRKQLETVKRTRGLHRKARQEVPYPIVAIVGYTNAGKSTLFNKLTGANVMAENLLFATLDPTMRKIKLPSGREIILSDTVGFISELPTHLVAAFRATLEEVQEADLILHVRDISHPDTDIQEQDVIDVLKDLGVQDRLETAYLELCNKMDLVSPEDPTLQHHLKPESLPISALTGEGLDEVLRQIDLFFAQREDVFTITLLPEDGKKLAWLYEHGEILKRDETETEMTLTCRLSKIAKVRFDQLEKEKS